MIKLIQLKKIKSRKRIINIMKYDNNYHSVYKINYHIVFCVKYRKKLLQRKSPKD